MKIDIVSVFPEFFEVAQLSLLGKAQDKGILQVQAHNLRDWTHDVHHSVDDTPVGGGAGMVMKAEVWAECLDDLLGLSTSAPTQAQGTSPADATGFTDRQPVLIFPNPSAPLFTQSAASELSQAEHLIFGCGRYEGYDARIPTYYRRQGIQTREYSIGDYILNGGEAAVAVMVEAITRLIPGFMGNPNSIIEESYTGDESLLEYRQYTRPSSWRGIEVPSILTSGDHGKVDRFRRDESLELTSRIRPDLIEHLDCNRLDIKDKNKLRDLGWNVDGSHPRHGTQGRSHL
ncbi:tRNA (guanosine(37)-N1)-methyltransferase TrmD [Bombiscardovia coagulans]|uniref:tRNA (guanine-N(1)-)-methyltransferase n=1 Tax=Bombiscardovia coagulans TaxID=686666 RepID=A0A261EUZ6_9BIFI|nr:tRNA (guanosine(37)-N1)-methyltransferase TrmD [Bombiscardovia coagulans]OZG50682.1 tRNA (guanine-N1)-methyltransferase [Bombiscardovia coagulans]